MPEYRWNQMDMAVGYDVGAQLIHPHYVGVQDAILGQLPFDAASDGVIVDMGGGSGRLIERVFERWPGVRAVIIDQSQAFLDLAAARLERFGPRTTFLRRCLQEPWHEQLPAPATALVSMSAIHHLDPAEKQDCYGRCFDVLRPGGILLNGDEVRPETDDEYRQVVLRWAAHMQRLIDTDAVTPAMAEGLRKWQARNVDQFGGPRVSGDDCHETAAAQLGYFEAAGFVDCKAVWSQELWTVLSGRRPSASSE